jgi:hypothetical protein
MDAPDPSRRVWHSHEWNVLVVIALISGLGLGWLGWQATIVRHRRAMREQIKASGGWADDGLSYTPFNTAAPKGYVFRDHTIPKIRELLGDEAVAWITFRREPTASDREALEAFPEANVVGVPDPRPSPARRATR